MVYPYMMRCNMIICMGWDASIPDIALEPDHTVRKVQEKFRLDFTDEEATSYMQDLIDESASAVMAALAERIHKLAQFMRN